MLVLPPRCDTSEGLASIPQKQKQKQQVVRFVSRCSRKFPLQYYIAYLCAIKDLLVSGSEIFFKEKFLTDRTKLSVTPPKKILVTALAVAHLPASSLCCLLPENVE